MSDPSPLSGKTRDEVLESWKEIAAYVGKGVRTVVRWEKTEAFPIHRHQHERRSAVFAYKSEIDEWWSGRQTTLCPSQPEPTSPRIGVWLWFVSLIPVAAAAIWLLRPSKSRTPEIPLHLEPLTSYPGAQSSPSFSPDGNHFAFAWSGWRNDNVDIYVQAIGSSEPKRLTEHSWLEFSPAWSPDGKSIAFLRRSPKFQIELLLIPSLGGAERKLADLREAHYMDAPQLSWSPDAKWLAFADRDNDGAGIFGLAVETGERRRLTKARAPRNDLDPAFSPDGRRLAFRRGQSESQTEIYVQALSEGVKPIGEPERLTKRSVRSTSPVWAGDGEYIFFSSGIINSGFDDIYRLRVRARTSADPERLTAAIGESFYTLTASPHGRLLACTRKKGEVAIWEVEKTGQSWTPPKSLEFFSSTRSDADPALSPDGQQIAFVSNRSGHPELWVSQRNGSHARKLTFFDTASVSSPRWSPDGKRITFSALWNDDCAVWTIDVAGGPPRKLVEPAWSSSWSQDGKWIYYSSPTHESPSIFKVPANGGPSLKLLDTGDLPTPTVDTGSAADNRVTTLRAWEFGNLPVESADGKLLYFYAPGGLWVLPIAGGRAELVAKLPSQYAICNDGVYFKGPAKPDVHERPLLFYRFADRATLEVTPLGPRPQKGITTSRDCNTVLYSQIVRESSSLMFVRGLW